MTKSMLWTSVFLLASAVAIAGCGGDDDDSGDAGGPGTGGIGAGTGGVGTGTGGTTGTGGATGTGGSMSTGTVMCGTATCMAPGFGGMTFGTACCVDATAGTCGIQAMDGTCPPPPVSDPRCPAGPMLGPISVASCCTADNKCGYDGSMFMMGCVDLASVASSQLGAILMPPAPRSCDGTGDDGGAPTDNDAGN